LESHAGESQIIPEFQGYPGNNSLVAAISFSEATKHHKELNQVDKEDGEPQPRF
jgi:hypothetical protein